MRKLWLVGILCVAVVGLAACSSGGAPTTAGTTRLGASPSEASTPNPTIADPLEGEWQASITCKEMATALQRAGLGSSVPDSIKCPVEDLVRFQNGRLVLFSNGELGWDTTYRFIDDNTFVTSGEDVLTFDFRIDHGRLYADVVGPSDAPAPFIAHWESTPFERSS
jgi:hypothetical protein